MSTIKLHIFFALSQRKVYIKKIKKFESIPNFKLQKVYKIPVLYTHNVYNIFTPLPWNYFPIHGTKVLPN